jgi:hypothetical protein
VESRRVAAALGFREYGAQFSFKLALSFTSHEGDAGKG